MAKELCQKGGLTLGEDGLALDGRGRTWIPEGTLRKWLIRTAHDSAMAGHRDAETTLQRLRNFTWPDQRDDVVKAVKACLPCQMAKGRTGKLEGRMGE